MGEILAEFDDSDAGTLDADRWVPGWLDPLHKCFRRAIKKPAGATSSLARVIDDFFRQVRRHLDGADDAGPSAFKLFLRFLSAHFDHGDHGRAFERLRAFGVPTDIVFSVYLGAFRELTLVVQGTEKVFKPSDPMVYEIVRTSVNRQYPALTPASYPGNMMTAVEPFVSVSATWLAFNVYVTNKTPAINCEQKQLFYLPRRPHDVFVVPAVIGICSADALAQFHPCPPGYSAEPLCYACCTRSIG